MAFITWILSLSQGESSPLFCWQDSEFRLSKIPLGVNPKGLPLGYTSALAFFLNFQLKYDMLVLGLVGAFDPYCPIGFLVSL